MTIHLIAVTLAAALVAYVLATVTAALIARTPFPLPPSQRRIGCLDGLRGYVALSVLIHHFIFWMQVTRFNGTWEAPAVNLFNQLGAGGVALFFMTTGFVFYPRVLAGFRACSWPAIYTTRLFRIVPLVAVSVAIITIIIAMRTGAGLDRGFPNAAAQWITTWDEPPLLRYPDSGRLNAYVLWSLWHEWLFYLIVLPASALAMDLIRGTLPSWVLPVGLLLTTVVARVLYLPGSMLRYLPLFAFGMIAYECQSREWIARALRTPRAASVAALALGVGMIAAPTPYTFVMPVFGFFFTCVACGNDMGGLLRTKGALILGECSYGIYLLHGILLSLLFVDASKVTGSIATDWLPILLPLAAVVIVLVTPVTYLLIERPAIRAGRHLSQRWTRRRLRTDAPELQVAP
ncbi:acyltransferase family protein [Methylobacterium sp. E-066]|uniref:acyltransferase family protein n=1 Tax=Methylobacterium sp. E-066 TaxID=2836584 RepID=UPI001FBC10C2|nr:acyltransferase [Methylobacterium sp. E-066]MCJ2142187.1 acyltransferase [Methylobacterium sp. E-066]